MATIDELIQQLDVLKADDKMDREDRSDKMRKIRRQIRKLGGRLRDAPPPGQESTRRSTRSRRKEIRIHRTREPEDMESFLKNLMRYYKQVHPELEFSKISIDHKYHAFPANLMMDEIENGGHPLEVFAELLIEKYYSRWGSYPITRSAFRQGEIPILCFEINQEIPGPNTPIFRQNSVKAW